MKIDIQFNNDDKVVTVTDDGLDNQNFVCISVGEKSEVVPLTDLLAAVHAFEQKRAMTTIQENKYRD